MFQSKQVLDVSSSATGPVSDFRSLGILLRHTFRKASNDAVGTRDGQVFCRAADLPRILSSLDISLDREDVEFLAWRCLEIHARGKSKAESLDWIAPYTSAARRTDRGGNNTKGGPPSSDAPLLYVSDLCTYLWSLKKNEDFSGDLLSGDK